MITLPGKSKLWFTHSKQEFTLSKQGFTMGLDKKP